MVLWISFQIPILHCQYIRKQWTFLYWPFIMQTCYHCIVVLGCFLLILWNFLDNYIICEQSLFFSSEYVCFFLSCLVLSISVQCWKEVVRGTSCVFPALRERASSFSPFDCISCRFFLDVLYQVDKVPHLVCWEFLWWMGVGFCQMNLIIIWYYFDSLLMWWITFTDF